MRHTKKRAPRRLVALTLVGLLGLSAVTTAVAKATEEDLAKVRIGMSRAEVESIMGRPDRSQRVEDEDRELCWLYVYKGVGRYKIVNIWFDCQDKVKAIDKAS